MLAAAPVSGPPFATGLWQLHRNFEAAEPEQSSDTDDRSSDGLLHERSRLSDGQQVQDTGHPHILPCQFTLCTQRSQASLHPSSQSRSLRAGEQAALCSVLCALHRRAAVTLECHLAPLNSVWGCSGMFEKHLRP